MIRDRYTVVARSPRGLTIMSEPRSGFFQSHTEAMLAAQKMVGALGLSYRIDIRYYDVSESDVVVWRVSTIWVDLDGKSSMEECTEIIGKFDYTGDPVRARVA